MKKKIAVFACIVALMFTFTVVSFAEGETSGNGDVMWNLWELLSSSNVDYLGIIGILITTVVTFIRMLGGSSNIVANLKHAFEVFFEFLK